MKRQPPSSGFTGVIWVYIGARLGVLLLSGALAFVFYPSYLRPDILPVVAMFMADVAFLLIFMAWPWMRKRLGDLYLPIAIIVSALVPIIEAPPLYSIFGMSSVGSFLVVFPFLSVSLIITAWQYRLRRVVLFSASTAMAEIVMILYYYQGISLDITFYVVSVILRSAFFIMVGAVICNLVAAQRRQQDELAAANRRLIQYATALEQLTISRERNRLARELHDTVAHTLSGLAVQLDGISAVCGEITPRAREMLDRALDTTRQGLKETRRALGALRATPLEDLGLLLALRQLAEDVAEREGLALTIELPQLRRSLAPELEQAIYRVAQEALENVSRHAQARSVALTLGWEGPDLVLRVIDDGLGLEHGQNAEDLGLGIRGMRERADLVGGHLSVTQGDPAGTIVRLLVENPSLAAGGGVP